mmetsp:Transcript_21937/g.45092  ORF Transcript_21937/g.45092 Transcript_21937/m.45092 type:complete len:304 (-) Transcript_21937:1106-2017(-)
MVIKLCVPDTISVSGSNCNDSVRFVATCGHSASIDCGFHFAQGRLEGRERHFIVLFNENLASCVSGPLQLESSHFNLVFWKLKNLLFSLGFLNLDRNLFGSPVFGHIFFCSVRTSYGAPNRSIAQIVALKFDEAKQAINVVSVSATIQDWISESIVWESERVCRPGKFIFNTSSTRVQLDHSTGVERVFVGNMSCRDERLSVLGGGQSDQSTGGSKSPNFRRIFKVDSNGDRGVGCQPGRKDLFAVRREGRLPIDSGCPVDGLPSSVGNFHINRPDHDVVDNQAACYRIFNDDCELQDGIIDL